MLPHWPAVGITGRALPNGPRFPFGEWIGIGINESVCGIDAVAALKILDEFNGFAWNRACHVVVRQFASNLMHQCHPTV